MDSIIIMMWYGMENWADMEISFFVYGSLLFEDVWEQLIGRRPLVHPTRLLGYRRYSVEEAFYPGMWFSEMDQVEGGVVLLTKQEECCIDDYEGEEYIKTVVPICDVEGIVSARTYLRPPFDLKEWDTEWTEDIFHQYRRGFFSF